MVAALAVGQTFVILTAGIDLSVGAIAILAADGDGQDVGRSRRCPVCLALAIGIGVAFLGGALNGVLVTRVKLPPFIVTLGTLSIFTALGAAVHQGSQRPGPGHARAVDMDRQVILDRQRSGSRPAC